VNKRTSENNTPSTAEPNTNEGFPLETTPTKAELSPVHKTSMPVVNDEYAEFCKMRFNELIMANPELATD
jgi:hypothetical protein